MRSFNKLFVIALPRCATVSLCDALGQMGIATAHLGRIYGENTLLHHDPVRMLKIYEQIVQQDYELDILQHCRGLADYPACCFEVMRNLDRVFPGSLFINLRRDADIDRWLQSVECQFIGLQLLKAGQAASAEEQAFMRTMLSFRKMTFGHAEFDAELYRAAYWRYQEQVDMHFSTRQSDLLCMEDLRDLESTGFEQLASFLDCETPCIPFPRSNEHSKLPSKTFHEHLAEGRIVSQTGIVPSTV